MFWAVFSSVASPWVQCLFWHTAELEIYCTSGFWQVTPKLIILKFKNISLGAVLMYKTKNILYPLTLFYFCLFVCLLFFFFRTGKAKLRKYMTGDRTNSLVLLWRNWMKQAISCARIFGIYQISLRKISTPSCIDQNTKHHVCAW